ncbi:MAG: TatD family hydrolase [Candidatus Omnitrophica bacterium]|nr:TatD family hydrolase [Candidatus Omnitrophota bacterium]
MLIDTHAHLDHVENLDEALAQAVAAGVTEIVAVSMDLASMQKSLEIKNNFFSPQIYLGLGIHPGNIKTEEIEEALDFLKSHMGQAQVVGEIGLDFWYKWVRQDAEKKKQQRDVFRRQLVLAKEHNRPVVVHARGTWRECFETVREVGIQSAVFHWYSGPVDVMQDIVSAGYFVSTTPSLAYSPQSQEAIRHAPIESTLIETDSPVFYRYDASREDGFKSQPKDVVRTLQIYARYKGLAEEKAAQILNANAHRFLGIG